MISRKNIPLQADPAAARIAIVSPIFSYGGVLTYWQDAMNQLPEKKWLWFTNETSGVPSDPFQHERVCVRANFVWTSVWQTTRNLIRDLDDFSPSTVIFNGTLAVVKALPAILYLKFFRPKMRLQNVFHNCAIYPTWPKNFINRLSLSACGFLMDRNIFVSQAVSRYWWCRGFIWPRPFVARPKSIENMRFAPITPTNEELPMIGFLGRLSIEKDPDFFLEVLDVVRQKIPCRTILAGVGSLRERLERQYPWAEFAGWVEPIEWLKGIDLLVISSRSEGWPYALGEAIGCGTPVVGRDVGGVGEILAPVKEDFLVLERDVQGLALIICNFLNHYQATYSRYFKAFTEGPLAQVSPEDWAGRLIDPDSSLSQRRGASPNGA